MKCGKDDKTKKSVEYALIWLSEKEQGISLIPWFMLYFFVAVCLFLMLFSQNVHISTKYIVQDSLAAAALAGEVVDLEILSQNKELIIVDLGYAKEAFEESLKASLHLDQQGYPNVQSAYFDSSVPITIVELCVYNVSKGNVYVSDLLSTTGVLQYRQEEGIIADSKSRLLGPIYSDTGAYQQCVTMLDGEEKEIKSTSLYARIRFGVPGFHGTTIMIEKDIFTDIQENN